ncbi:aa3-type cytochrome c oxidase subunit IV [Rhizobium sp. CECT 9324]|jgi:hypothetical protein|uniref:aa3-type cytochrome c oxidase subunit IV n=1 Tax=Rhizobium sp. CECT 9324 TaxID=2845820 RepID=UPI001E4C8C61|nr:aa3-type cytochrome c oxidase subunit IV [Rhizobium sp. CECT 9324]CAH0341816.1 hypothetical protein RHI9324_03521 [Rhizobium sp. CECT 9324]
MSEHHSGPVETGAPMNYAEHEKTYDMFIAGTKFGTIILVALMIAMGIGFFTSAGLIGGFLAWVALSGAGVVMMR